MEDPTFRIGDEGGEIVPVDLTYGRVLCAQHGEPLRQNWPDGFLDFSEALFEALTKTDGFDLIVDVVHRDNGGLVQDDAFSTGENTGIGRSEIDRQVVGKERHRP